MMAMVSSTINRLLEDPLLIQFDISGLIGFFSQQGQGLS